MFPLIALPIIFSIVVAAAVLARQRRRRTSFRRSHDLTPVSEQWLADRRRSD
jgi:hypothetical protein